MKLLATVVVLASWCSLFPRALVLSLHCGRNSSSYAGEQLLWGRPTDVRRDHVDFHERGEAGRIGIRL